MSFIVAASNTELRLELASFVDSATRIATVERLHAENDGSAAGVLHAAGGVLLTLTLLMATGVAADSRLAGHAWMSTKLGLLTNGTTALLACFLIGLSRYAQEFQASSAAVFVIVVAVLVLLESVFGAVASVSHDQRMLRVHAAASGLTCVLLVAAAAAALAAGGVRAPLETALTAVGGCTRAQSNSTSQPCVESIVFENYASTHLELTGALAAVLAVAALVNVCSAATLQWVLLSRESTRLLPESTRAVALVEIASKSS